MWKANKGLPILGVVLHIWVPSLIPNAFQSISRSGGHIDRSVQMSNGLVVISSVCKEKSECLHTSYVFSVLLNASVTKSWIEFLLYYVSQVLSGTCFFGPRQQFGPVFVIVLRPHLLSHSLNKLNILSKLVHSVCMIKYPGKSFAFVKRHIKIYTCRGPWNKIPATTEKCVHPQHCNPAYIQWFNWAVAVWSIR